MKKILLGLFTIGILLSCNNVNDSININEQNFLIFGHYYGKCIGENCVETFKLTDKGLFEDSVDDRNGENMKFIQLDNKKFLKVRDLADFFPSQLLNEKETIIGCPDCADGGGLFIQYSENGNIRSWRIDQEKENVPLYLHSFIDKVNEKIKLINN